MTTTGSPPLWNVPNLLSLSRLPLAVALFVCIDQKLWFIGLVLFLIASFTDWLDGWWARRYQQSSPVGRALDPLTDKVLVCGTFIFLVPVKEANIEPWMVTVIVGRELLVTGLRGIVEATGKNFGADWFGKLKMALQCAVLIGVLLIQSLRAVSWAQDWLDTFEMLQIGILYLTLIATIGSGLQYIVKAVKILS